MTTVEAGKATERLRFEVTITVTHSVTVSFEAESDQTIDDLKAKALEEFHRDPTRGAGGRRTDDTWRTQFANRTNIHVGSEQTAIAAVKTVPRPSY